MPAANIDSTSRKVSGSSSHSTGHSPSNSPGNPQRKLAQGGSNDMLGHGMSSKGLKGYNAGWHVWGGPGSKRTASVSSINELAPPSDAWSQSRASSGSWDEGSQKKDDAHSAQYARQRQATAAQAAALSGDRSGGYAPSSMYGNPNGYDANGASNVDDLTSALRGMAVADDLGGAQSSMPQPRTAMSYSPYYSAQGGQGDYAYGYADPSSFTPAGMAAGASTPGVFYDYSASARPPASPYYYPSQPMMWASAPSPMLTPQLPAAVPATLSDKKRELQYNLQQSAQMNHQNLMYQQPLRSPTSPAYPSLDYAGQMGMMMPNGTMYGHSRSNSQSGAGHRPRRDDLGHLRSELLEEFRANKTRKWDLRDIFGHIAEFSGDQHGSRFIQQKLEAASMEEKEVVFNEIVPAHSLQLSQDVFGNYVVQKLFEYGTPTQRTLMASTLEGHVLALSLQIYGCRVVQKAIESVPEALQATFVKELEPHVIRCVKDANGNHVIQKVIERVSARSLGFVDSFRGHVYELASHPYGCRVLQRCFEYLAPEQTRPLLDELHECTLNLMQDQFGNYVIQFVLERGSPRDRSEVVQKLKGQLLNMARHKFASNVCEKALVTADLEDRRALIEEVMSVKSDGVSPIVVMMKDQFANYVLQRAVIVSDPEQKELLISRIRPQLVSMRRYNNAYTKHLIAIERLLDKCTKAQEAAGHSEAQAAP